MKQTRMGSWHALIDECINFAAKNFEEIQQICPNSFLNLDCFIGEEIIEEYLSLKQRTGSVVDISKVIKLLSSLKRMNIQDLFQEQQRKFKVKPNCKYFIIFSSLD